MNLLTKQKTELKDNNAIHIYNFRREQYNLIPYICNNIIEYLSRLNNNYLEVSNIIIEPLINYYGTTNTQLTSIQVICKIDGTVSDKVFLDLRVPTLLEDNLFYLNGNYYVPALYAVDYPIVNKKNSIMLYSLFNSITLYMKDNIAIFTGVNIPLQHFLQIFLSDTEEDINLYKEFMKKYKKDEGFETELNIITYFNNKFYVKAKTKQELIQFIESIFFDSYSYYLYKNIYGSSFEITLTNIIKRGILYNINNFNLNFVDLSNKRIVFIEMLWRTLLDRISSNIKHIRIGSKIDVLKIDQLIVLKHFNSSPDPKKKRKGLSGNYLCDSVVNLYDGFLIYKVLMVPPGIERAPKEVHGIHDSHYGNICPITISSQKPGHSVSLTPTVHVDPFGCFL